MDLIQIVPGMPPQTDGIGDYAVQLAKPLRDEHGIQSHFLVGDPKWNGTAVQGFEIGKVQQRTVQSFLAAVAEMEERVGKGPLPILVQFSPYGYEKRGCPFWLVEGLESLRRQRPGGLHAAFHELENRSWRPWSSTFWVPGIQQHLLERVARLSSFRYTNTELHRRKLEDWGVGRFHLIPNFSTIEEPRHNPPFETRNPDLIVFGRAAQRRWTYKHGAKLLGPLCSLIGASRIMDIGEPLKEMTAAEFDGVPLIRFGRISETEVIELMAHSIASFTYYPIQSLLKSSVFAVSAAFGTIPFICDNQLKPRSAPGLITGRDFIALDNDLSRVLLPPLAQLSEDVFMGYQSRAASPAAKSVAFHLRSFTR